MQNKVNDLARPTTKDIGWDRMRKIPSFVHLLALNPGTCKLVVLGMEQSRENHNQIHRSLSFATVFLDFLSTLSPISGFKRNFN